MSIPATQNPTALERLHSISSTMLAFAKAGKWDSVKDCDDKRLRLLKEYKQNDSDQVLTQSRKILIDEILDFDRRIYELANGERKSLIDEEIRYKAQVTAQTNYKQALSTKTGL